MADNDQIVMVANEAIHTLGVLSQCLREGADPTATADQADYWQEVLMDCLVMARDSL